MSFSRFLLILVLLSQTVVACELTGKDRSVKPVVKTKQLISGFAQGFEDSTWLYLYEWTTGNILDSSRIVNGQFKLMVPASFKEKSRLFTIATGSFSDHKVFWMDQKDIMFRAVKGNFKSAKISGSKTQELFDRHQRNTEPLVLEIDSLRRFFGDTDSAMLQKTNKLVDQLKQLNVRFIEQHRESLISAYLLRMHCIEWGVTLSHRLFSTLAQNNQKSNYGEFVKKFITNNKDIAVGKSYVDFEQTTSDGKPVRLSSFIGKYILLEFWASWCGPCRKENPALVKFYEQYKQHGFEIVAVSLDANEQQWIDAIEKDGLTWPNVSDLKGGDNVPALMYGVYGIPDNFLIDPTGKIIAKNLRGSALEKKLSELFGK